MTTERTVGRVESVKIASAETSAAILDTPKDPSPEAEERLVEVYRVTAQLMVEKGYADEKALTLENLTAITRAGASIILSYHTRDILTYGWLND